MLGDEPPTALAGRVSQHVLGIDPKPATLWPVEKPRQDRTAFEK